MYYSLGHLDEVGPRSTRRRGDCPGWVLPVIRHMSGAASIAGQGRCMMSYNMSLMKLHDVLGKYLGGGSRMPRRH